MGDLASTSPPTEKLGLGEVGVVGLVTSSLKIGDVVIERKKNREIDSER